MLYFFKNFFNSSENVRILSVYALYLVSQPSGGPWAKWVQIIKMIHTEFALRYGCIISLFSDLALDIAPDNIAQGVWGTWRYTASNKYLAPSWNKPPNWLIHDASSISFGCTTKIFTRKYDFFRILNTKGWWSSNCIFGTYIYLGFSIKIVLANS